MKIGFIGASAVAQTIAKHALLQKHEVVLSNSRGPESLSAVVNELGSGATAGTVPQAAQQDIVVLAVRWSSVQAALFSVSDWKGRILVDATNRIVSFNPFSLGDLSGRTSSEIVGDLAPDPETIIKPGQFSMEIPGHFSAEIDIQLPGTSLERQATTKRTSSSFVTRRARSSARSSIPAPKSCRGYGSIDERFVYRWCDHGLR